MKFISLLIVATLLVLFGLYLLGVPDAVFNDHPIRAGIGVVFMILAGAMFGALSKE